LTGSTPRSAVLFTSILAVVTVVEAHD